MPAPFDQDRFDPPLFDPPLFDTVLVGLCGRAGPDGWRRAPGEVVLVECYRFGSGDAGEAASSGAPAASVCAAEIRVEAHYESPLPVFALVGLHPHRRTVGWRVTLDQPGRVLELHTRRLRYGIDPFDATAALDAVRAEWVLDALAARGSPPPRAG